MSGDSVFVIGGGPAGLATAIAARLRGFEVQVADGAAPPVDKACGEGVMPDGVAAARALGLDLEPAGYPFRGIRFAAADAASPAVSADFPHGRGLGVRRTVLHRLMLERAASLGVQFRWGAAVTGLEGIRARWIVGADGSRSLVRRWAGLERSAHQSQRYGFRRHYCIAPWSEYMELYWGRRCQLYLTPVGPEEVCAVLISRDPRLRLDDALPEFPEVAARLRGAAGAGSERGGVTVSRRLNAVWRGSVALVGDASGSVDAVTGEGLCLLFQQAVALADAMAGGDLKSYGLAHRRIGRRPELMSTLLLALDGRSSLRSGLRARALRAMAARPPLFRELLAAHVGERSTFDILTNGLALGWQMLTL